MFLKAAQLTEYGFENSLARIGICFQASVGHHMRRKVELSCGCVSRDKRVDYSDLEAHPCG